MRGEDDYEDSELASPPPIVNNYYGRNGHSNGNGSGNGMLMKLLIGICGFLLALLVTQNYLDQTKNAEFRQQVVERLTRLETRLAIGIQP